MQVMIKNDIVDKDLSDIYQADFINWEEFRNKTVLITGVTGGIGSMAVRSFLFANEKAGLDIEVIGLVRNIKKAKIFFEDLTENKNFKLIKNDITEKINYNGKVDYIIHCANNTSSRSFVEMPVETMEVAFCGTKNVLEFAENKKVKSLVFLSSMEIYGFIEGQDKTQSENDLGSLELLNVRNSYPIGKRAAETLCCSFFKEKNVPVKIARLAQTVGANVDYNDSRVYAYFARNIVEKKDIVLNTTGNTIRSYCYITDVITGIILLLQKGVNGEAYNIANEEATSSIKNIANMLVNKYPDSKLVFNINDTGIFPKETVWALKTDKIKALGWKPYVSQEKMYANLINSFSKQFNAVNNKLNKKSGKWYQEVFSITNQSAHKVIKLCGFKICISQQKLFAKYKNLPIKNNKIVFSNFNGSGYGCNPKYILEEILRQNLPYEICWLTNNVRKELKNFPSRVRLVNLKSKQALKELSTSKIWIDNQRKVFHIQRGLEKKDNQFYINTWHGSLGIKKVGVDSPVNSIQNDWIPYGKKDSEMLDYLISNSTFENDVYKNNFWDNGKILTFGHPRNDIFFYNDEKLNEIKKRVFKKLNIALNKKVLLYVPTFRDYGSLDSYNLEVENLLKSITDKFDGEWVFAVRMHPHLKNKAGKLFKFGFNIVNASSYSDIQELLVSSDIAITDYSSCIFDFMLSRKPAFIFATDIEKFNNERGFYYPLESTPFPIAKNNEELIQNILDFDNEKYKREVEEFLTDKGCVEDGNATERVVDLIKEIIKE